MWKNTQVYFSSFNHSIKTFIVPVSFSVYWQHTYQQQFATIKINTLMVLFITLDGVKRMERICVEVWNRHL